MTTLNSFLETQEPSDWLDSLPNYQKDIVAELLTTNSHEDAAKTWLEASTGNTSPFSGEQKSEKKYFIQLKKEVYKLLCGDPKYATERDEFTQLIQSPDNKTLLVSSISGLIGSQIGLAASFVAPVIVIILMTLAKTSLNAWCEVQVPTP
ncbi:hypothetical protein COJ60_22020 [Bacillus cereus]|uniref:hypothetical protein n=1 Tax=Bacillus TaxID=1386 RepID=UPI000936335E|nr:MULTISPECIES: hypothetical protein [Bacillus cereus group]PFN32016.1 hypothetical protein COJ60_22020 [Bacillus cereus]MCU5208574.1 hypothetical protein [Bacillus paranthracis]MDA2160897.1 hypothetical protein [Bacillus cereus group sp. Bc252]MDF9512457.1 hypothetical protein [Bacillus paranthracis]MDF9670518.1 hypothetical protein [Bacillus paranthracis]